MHRRPPTPCYPVTSDVPDDCTTKPNNHGPTGGPLAEPDSSVDKRLDNLAIFHPLFHIVITAQFPGIYNEDPNRLKPPLCVTHLRIFMGVNKMQ